MIPRGASRASTSIRAGAAAGEAAAVREGVAAVARSSVPSKSGGTIQSTLIRRLSIPDMLGAPLLSIMVMHAELEECADGTRLVQRWIVVGSAIGGGIERRQTVGDIVDGRGHLQVRREFVLGV